MKFSFGSIVSFAAGALQLTSAFPTTAPNDVSIAAPVAVKSLTCDGDTYKCTAGLVFGNGRWVAQWSTSVFHQQTLARPSAMDLAMMAPVPVKSVYCDGDTYECTANLVYGDGHWVARWSVAVFHQSMFNDRAMTGGRVGTMAPVAVTSMTCDGDTYKCTAALNFGDNRWVAQWSTAVFQSGAGGGLFLQ